MTELIVVSQPVELARQAAGWLDLEVSNAIAERGSCALGVAGGRTPDPVYRELASGSSIDWQQVEVFFGDERAVPPDHPESNYRMAHEAMLSKLPLSPQNVFRIPAEEDNAAVAAARYEQALRDFFRLGPDQFPRFDLILLGMGPDGHTASLFPNTAALNESSSLVVANWVEKFNTFRITLTLPVLNHSAFVMFLVSGQDKALALQQALADNSASVPAARVRPLDGRLLWLVDREAASCLSANQKRGS